MYKAPKVRSFAVCVCLAALAPASARSETAGEPLDPASASSPAPPYGRALNGHIFMPAVDVPWPFTVTSLTSDLVLGYGQTTGTVQISNQTFGGTLDYAGIGGLLAYEYAFLDHFTARALINNIVYSGLNGKSALAIGSQMRLGFSAGFTASLPIGDTARVGFLFDFISNPSLGLTPAAGLSAFAATCSQPSGCQVDSTEIFSSTDVLTVQPAVAASWAPFRTLGLTANVAYQHLSSTGASNVSGNAINFAAAADYDFGAMSSVPIGLQMQVSWTVPFSATGVQHVTDLGGGIFYTARKELSAGFQLISRRFAVTPQVDVSWSTFLMTAGLRYFWL
jgi:hypothetical protein